MHNAFPARAVVTGRLQGIAARCGRDLDLVPGDMMMAEETTGTPRALDRAPGKRAPLDKRVVESWETKRASMDKGSFSVQEGRVISGEELFAMSDIGPCELVEGRITALVPTGVEHGGHEFAFSAAIGAFVKPRKLGKVLVGEVGIYTRRNPDTVRAADVVFISKGRFSRHQCKSGFLDVAPDLIVEILSPSDSWSEVMKKLGEYFACGVRLVWVADPATRTVNAYRSLTDVREFSGKDQLPGDDVLPGFSAPVASLFEE